jgi:hypothetical protein
LLVRWTATRIGPLRRGRLASFGVVMPSSSVAARTMEGSAARLVRRPVRLVGTIQGTSNGCACQTQMNDKSEPWQLSAEEIYRLIRETAYLKAEARNFAPGVELEDWLQAEKEVWEKLRSVKGAPGGNRP